MTTTTITGDPLVEIWQATERDRVAVFRGIAAEFPQDSDIDYGEFIHEQARRFSMSKDELKRGLDAVYATRYCPGITAHYDDGFYLSSRHLLAITNAISSAPEHPDTDQLADALVCKRIEALGEGETLPSPESLRGWLSRHLRTTIADLDVTDEEEAKQDAEAEEEPTPPKAEYYSDREGNVGLTTTPATAVIIDEIVARVAHKERIGFGEALIKVITENVDLQVNINAIGVPEAAGTPKMLYIHGADCLTNAETAWITSKVADTVDLTEMGRAFSEDVHDANPTLRGFVMARDGHCRYPDCDKTKNLELHHVAAFQRGGPTTASNLVCLCRHHHNKITGGAIRMYMTESGVCLWQPQIGQLVKTYPAGPVGDPKRFRFIVTEEDHKAAKGKYWRRWARNRGGRKR